MIDSLFFVAIRYLGENFRDQRGLFDSYIERFKQESLPGEFDHVGGAEVAAINNVRRFLDWWSDEATRQIWIRKIPELV
jgi:hypothetical protein